MADLQALRDGVCDESSFLDLLEALAGERADEVGKEASNPSSRWGPGANGWNNSSIEAFLGAAHAWGRDSARGLPLYEPPSNPWKRCADILLMGTLYE